MPAERTLAIIKPDAVSRGLAAPILSRVERAGFRVAGVKSLRLTREEAEGFYAVHRGKAFYNSVTDFMSSGPCVVLILEGPNAISKNRELMGATNPKDAASGTIRREFASNIERNIVHGSDAPATAAFEMGYFFNALEVCG